jgi:hypothetical protein
MPAGCASALTMLPRGDFFASCVAAGLGVDGAIDSTLGDVGLAEGEPPQADRLRPRVAVRAIADKDLL